VEQEPHSAIHCFSNWSSHATLLSKSVLRRRHAANSVDLHSLPPAMHLVAESDEESSVDIAMIRLARRQPGLGTHAFYLP
jgi:hypothetical protein